MTKDIFSIANQETNFKNSPLSARMRPQSLFEYIGQKHILGEGKLLTRAIESDRLSSLIFYGPPGTGKTTLAHCISQKTNAIFERINAVTSNVEEMRKVIKAAQNRRQMSAAKTILFVDEIHRFNKAQQDVLMPDVEDGNIILIGATVMNPFFSLIGPLVSRSLIFELKPLTQDDITQVLTRAIQDEARGFGQLSVKADHEALVFIARTCDGDARKALNSLEIGILTTEPNKDGNIIFDINVAQECIQRKQVVYDADGDAHYDTISAFIKSMRGSDPDATLYWLAKMIYAGEDPRFIARRICICAAEDVGNAQPQALILANAAMQVAEFVGFPEARIPLAQAATFIACSPKSNAVYKGIDKALKDVREKATQPIPDHLKDGHYAGAKKLGRATGYKYVHDFPNHYVPQEYMPHQEKYYEITEQGLEKKLKDYLNELRSK